MSLRPGSNPPAPGRRPEIPANPPRAVGLGRSDQLDRIERKLDALLEALAAEGEEEQDEPTRSLDGELVPGERDQSQSLG